MKTKKTFSFFIAACLFVNCVTVFGGAAGYLEINKQFICQTGTQNIAYRVICHGEDDVYTAWGSFQISIQNGSADSNGETYQAFFHTCANGRAYSEGTDIAVPYELPAEITVCSFTADVNTENVELESKKSVYDRKALYSSCFQDVWQIEADGDYNVIGFPTGTSIFNIYSECANFYSGGN